MRGTRFQTEKLKWIKFGWVRKSATDGAAPWCGRMDNWSTERKIYRENFDSILVSSGFACSAGKKKFCGIFLRFKTPSRLSVVECINSNVFRQIAFRSTISNARSIIAQFNLQTAELLGKYQCQLKASNSIDVKADSHRPKTVAENVIWNFHSILFRSHHLPQNELNRKSIVFCLLIRWRQNSSAIAGWKRETNDSQFAQGEQ